MRLLADGASGVNFWGAFVTRPERRAVDVGAGELTAILSEVSMSGCRAGGITFGVAVVVAQEGERQTAEGGRRAWCGWWRGKTASAL